MRLFQQRLISSPFSTVSTSKYGAHVDLSYAYNDRLSFKIGKVVDDEDGTVDDDVKFIASYSLPLGD